MTDRTARRRITAPIRRTSASSAIRKRKLATSEEEIIRPAKRARAGTSSREAARASLEAKKIEVRVEKWLLSSPTQSKFRSIEYIHVSDLLGECTRKIALSDRLKEPIICETITAATSIAFYTGHALQSLVTDHFMRTRPKVTYGIFACVCGQETFQGTYWDACKEGTCSSCRTGLHQYKEIVIREDEYWITGSIDLMLRLGGLYIPVEIKSIAKTGWHDLKKPKPDHTLQSLFYWWLLKRKGYPVANSTLVIYACKEFMSKRGSPYKIYRVHGPSNLHRLDEYLEEAEELAHFRTEGQLPDRVCCTSPTARKAKRCQFQTQCFVVQ